MLSSFLKILLSKEKTPIKSASIGQAIIQALRPTAVLAPLQVGLAIQLHHLTRSKFLVDELHNLGFCASYKEVQRYYINAANTSDFLDDCEDDDGVFQLLFAQDNVDHNITTLDGKGSFHGLGITAASTPAKTTTNQAVYRKTVKENPPSSTPKIPSLQYEYGKRHLEKKFKELPELPAVEVKVDLLWEFSCKFNQPMPLWQGIMATAHSKEQFPGVSNISFLRMIDLYSVIDHAYSQLYIMFQPLQGNTAKML